MKWITELCSGIVSQQNEALSVFLAVGHGPAKGSLEIQTWQVVGDTLLTTVFVPRPALWKLLLSLSLRKYSWLEKMFTVLPFLRLAKETFLLTSFLSWMHCARWKEDMTLGNSLDFQCRLKTRVFLGIYSVQEYLGVTDASSKINKAKFLSLPSFTYSHLKN